MDNITNIGANTTPMPVPFKSTTPRQPAPP